MFLPQHSRKIPPLPHSSIADSSPAVLIPVWEQKNLTAGMAHMRTVQTFGCNDKIHLPSVLPPACYLSVSFIHLKSPPFSFERPLVLKVQKPAFIWGGSRTINITTTRKCSRRAKELQVNRFPSRNLALPDSLSPSPPALFWAPLALPALWHLWHRFPHRDSPSMAPGAQGRAAPAAHSCFPWEGVPLRALSTSQRWQRVPKITLVGQGTRQTMATSPAEIKSLS